MPWRPRASPPALFSTVNWRCLRLTKTRIRVHGTIARGPAGSGASRLPEPGGTPFRSGLLQRYLFGS